MKIQPKALLPCIPGFERGMLMRLKKMLNSKGIVNIMYIPVILLFVSFIIYPLIKGIGISMTNWNGYSDASTYIGLENYRKMFADRNFFLIIKNTLIYGIGSAVLENVVGLLYAVLLDKKSKAVGFARTAIYLPVIVAPLIMGYIWYFMFEPIGGAVNDILIGLSLGGTTGYAINPARDLGPRIVYQFLPICRDCDDDLSGRFANDTGRLSGSGQN